ncbi:MAG: hypothetical protein BWY73_01507 [candidate division TA06 bacterium ADurb.Bin417]|uniref:Uncharacterized protein n=1 Tax=candidate division TA06 bacterium ADurb.Bin417 TaxID=1852828 RepID=A0A1V5M8D1_UNCT6|nr:MAG: hypothetical protein BWY73_01507 [candidate division TA06 bacterium ADurb.Bin417]
MASSASAADSVSASRFVQGVTRTFHFSLSRPAIASAASGPVSLLVTKIKVGSPLAAASFQALSVPTEGPLSAGTQITAKSAADTPETASPAKSA